MTIATLSDVLRPALRDGYAVAGLVVLGWEEARAFVDAAEALGVPVILQAGPGARRYMPLSVYGAMFRALAESASVPIVAHLDHGDSLATCRTAVDCGFTSVMYDGSALPLSQNVDITADVVAMAHSAGVSVEAELGLVGYAGGTASKATDPEEAVAMAATGIDALAVSVGNVHLMQDRSATIDRAALALIEARVPGLPLVLHGGSGIAAATRTALSRETAVCKFNIGTELRQVWGTYLREALARDSARFDRITLLSETIAPVAEATKTILRGL